ncbi:hypothetical protein, partial [Thiolapillus sp.]|uniref:hypothetical protein n=1 Tax=Thiolapillus sp. TaxID=2017437 RepID=UPI0025ED289C
MGSQHGRVAVLLRVRPVPLQPLRPLELSQPEAVPAGAPHRPVQYAPGHCRRKRVFGLVIDFGTSQSPKSTRPLTTYWCPSRPGHQALRNN